MRVGQNENVRSFEILFGLLVWYELASDHDLRIQPVDGNLLLNRFPVRDIVSWSSGNDQAIIFAASGQFRHSANSVFKTLIRSDTAKE